MSLHFGPMACFAKKTLSLPFAVSIISIIYSVSTKLLNGHRVVYYNGAIVKQYMYGNSQCVRNNAGARLVMINKQTSTCYD